MVFPGQGSQSLGMQAALAEAFPEVRDTYKEASDLLGFDLWEMTQNGPEDALNETLNTQPAMLTAGVATFRAWLEQGGAMPAIVAGHSLGEYSALVAAGALEFAAAVPLVRRRAELMQNAVPAGEGAMAAILGLDDDAVVGVCRDASSAGVAEAVNFNSPGQVVVAGQRAAIDRAIELAKAAGARRAIMLAVSVPSHSSLMQAAGDALAEALAATAFAAPEVTVVNAVDGVPYGDAGDIRERLTRQISSPVRWVRTIEYCISAGAESIIECGPGKVLTGLVRRIDRKLPAACIDAPDTLAAALNGANE